MSYAIIRNEKHTKGKTGSSNTHNERRNKNYSNKNIDPTRTHLNFHLKKPNLTYIKEFQRIKEDYNLKGQIKTTSNITCEYMVTSDPKFFDSIGYEETKRYFQESYNFLCNYRGLEEKYIISAVVHMDEESPHMHFTYVPVVHTVDKLGNSIEKLSCRDFWHGKNTYGNLQDNFYEHVTSKGFDLERGQPKEITGRDYLPPEKYKQATNYYETKKMLKRITLKLPDVPDLKDFKKVMMGRDEKIMNEIIKPKDILIKELYNNNLVLHKELSRQTKVIDKATEYQIEYDSIIAYNKELEEETDKMKKDFNKKVEQVEKKYDVKAENLQVKFSDDTAKLKSDYESQLYEAERKAKKKYNELDKQYKFLQRVVNTLQKTVDKVFGWVSRTLSSKNKEEIKADFEYDTGRHLDPYDQIEKEEMDKENEMVL